LLDDVFSLADGSYVEYDQALSYAKEALITEKDYIAWSTASSKFLKLLPLIKTRGAYPDFKVEIYTIAINSIIVIFLFSRNLSRLWFRNNTIFWDGLMMESLFKSKFR
jgi:hypothetical protein